MSHLFVELDRVYPPAPLVHELQDALSDGGISFGTLSISPVSAQPNLARVVWKAPGYTPLDVTLPGSRLQHAPGFRIIAALLLQKWRSRVVGLVGRV